MINDEIDILQEPRTILTSDFDYILGFPKPMLVRWVEKMSVEEIQYFSEKLTPMEVIDRSIEKIHEIEKWYINKHNTLIKQAGKKRQIDVTSWLLSEDSFLQNQMETEFKYYCNALHNLKTTSVSLSDHVRDTTSIEGFVKVYKHYSLNPIDTIRGFIGKSSLDVKREAIRDDFTNAVETFFSKSLLLVEQIELIIASKWNDELLVSLAEIENLNFMDLCMDKVKSISFVKLVTFGVIIGISILVLVVALNAIK
jgi:hypothetical protein